MLVSAFCHSYVGALATFDVTRTSVVFHNCIRRCVCLRVRLGAAATTFDVLASGGLVQGAAATRSIMASGDHEDYAATFNIPLTIDQSNTATMLGFMAKLMNQHVCKTITTWNT
jgi:hypothetical protein